MLPRRADGTHLALMTGSLLDSECSPWPCGCAPPGPR
jgi:hypothetical protein